MASVRDSLQSVLPLSIYIVALQTLGWMEKLFALGHSLPSRSPTLPCQPSSSLPCTELQKSIKDIKETAKSAMKTGKTLEAKLKKGELLNQLYIGTAFP